MKKKQTRLHTVNQRERKRERDGLILLCAFILLELSHEIKFASFDKAVDIINNIWTSSMLQLKKAYSL